MKLTIGKLSTAKQAHVTIETISVKVYSLSPLKPVIGYRLYPTDAISRLRCTKCAQQSGFTLNEILELLALDNEHCEDVQKMEK